MKNQTFRLENKNIIALNELKTVLEYSSKDEVINYAIDNLMNQKIHNQSLILSDDILESIIYNRISIILRHQTEELAKLLNTINYNQQVTQKMLEILLHNTTELEDIETAQKKLSSKLDYAEKIKRILEDDRGRYR